jgi:hypothetical protein
LSHFFPKVKEYKLITAGNSHLLLNNQHEVKRMKRNEFEFIKQVEDIFKLGYKGLYSFEKGYKQELAKFQKEMFLIGFANGIIYDRFTEEEAEDFLDLYLYFMEKELSKLEGSSANK